jgi:MFS family permease
MIGITISTTLSGRSIARTGRYKRFPIAGLALMTAALGLLAAFAADPSVATIGAGLVVFGLGFGMVTQVLITAVLNTVERRELGIAMAVTGFFRGLGGAVGAAILGAVFATQAGSTASDASGAGLGSVIRGDVIDGVQAVFLVAAPLAALALLIVLRLPESRLRTTTETRENRRTDEFRNEEVSVGT